MTSEEVAQLQKYWAEGNGDQWEAKTSLELLAHADALRARLEETERERDDYHQKALDIADQRDGFRDRAEAAERERDALKADLDDKQEVADLWMEKAMDFHSDLERIEKLTHNPGNRKPGNVLLMIRNVTRAAMPAPAEPLQAPKCDCVRGGGVGASGMCPVHSFSAEPLRTPERCKEREHGYTPCVLEQGHAGHHRNGSHTWGRVAEPLRTEGAPKQEEATILDVFHGANVATIAALQEQIGWHRNDARTAREANESLRAQVERLTKKLQFIADCGFDEDIDWRAFARAALAPEAPVEKETDT